MEPISKFWTVTDIIDEVKDWRQRERSVERVTNILIHRVGVDLRTKTKVGDGKTGPSIAKAFPSRSLLVFQDNVQTLTVLQRDLRQGLG